MILPVVNLNGSDPLMLSLQYAFAIEALEKAITAVRAIDCHGRDYQTIRDMPKAGLIAREEMEERLRKLSTIQHELRLVETSIQRQMNPTRPPAAPPLNPVGG